MVGSRRYTISIFLFLVLCISKLEVTGQSLPADALLAKALDSEEFLPLLIDAATKSSPQIKRSMNSVDIATSTLKINKNVLFSGIGLISSYNYGTNYSAVNNTATTVPGANSFTTAQTGFYNFGVAASLPITNIINRKHLLKSSQAQVNIALAEQENLTLEIKQQIIGLYQQLRLARKVFIINSNNLQIAKSNSSLAEKQFLQNQITIDQVSSVLESFNKAKVEYETALNNFQLIFMQLEVVVGVNLTTLLQQIK